MSIFDLLKATVTCGGVSFLIYTFPAVAQILMIGILSLLWLGYARKALGGYRRK